MYSWDAYLLTKPWSKKNSLPVIFIFKFLEKTKRMLRHRCSCNEKTKWFKFLQFDTTKTNCYKCSKTLKMSLEKTDHKWCVAISKDEHFKLHFVCTVSKMNLKCNVTTILKDEHFKSHFVCTVSKIKLMIWCTSAIYAKTDEFIWVLKILFNRLKKLSFSCPRHPNN